MRYTEEQYQELLRRQSLMKQLDSHTEGKPKPDALFETLNNHKQPGSRKKRKRKKQIPQKEKVDFTGVSVSSNHITRQVLKHLSYYPHNVKLWRQNNVAVYDKKLGRYREFIGLEGLSDIIGIIKGSGKWYAIEVKSGSDKMTPAQIEFQEMVRDFGGIAYCVWSLDEHLQYFEEQVKPLFS